MLTRVRWLIELIEILRVFLKLALLQGIIILILIMHLSSCATQKKGSGLSDSAKIQVLSRLSEIALLLGT